MGSPSPLTPLPASAGPPPAVVALSPSVDVDAVAVSHYQAAPYHAPSAVAAAPVAPKRKEENRYLDQQQKLLEVIREALSEHECLAVTMRYGLAGDEPRSTAEISKALNTTAAHVRVLLSRSTRKLQRHTARDPQVAAKLGIPA